MNHEFRNKESDKWKLSVAALGAICIFMTVLFCSAKAFRYVISGPDISRSYDLSDGETIIQPLNGNDMCLLGVAINFCTSQRVNNGTMLVELKEADTTLQSVSEDLSYISDNAFHEFVFPKPAKLSAGHSYSIALTCSYKNDDDSMALYVSDVDHGLNSNKGSLTGGMCYRLIGAYTGFRRGVITLSAIILGLFLLFFIRTDVFSKISITKIITAVIGCIVLIEIISVDLFAYIKTDVMMKTPADSGVYEEILPGDTWQTQVDAEHYAFDTISFFVKDNLTLGLTVNITNSQSGKVYVDRQLTKDDLVNDHAIGRNTVSITSSMPGELVFEPGTYTISVTNTGSQPVNIAAVDDVNGDPAAIDVALIKHTVNGYRLAILLIVILLMYSIAISLLSSGNAFSIQSFYLMTVLPLGIVYLLLFTPWNIPDMGAHFEAAYRHSNIFLGHGASWMVRKDDLSFFQAVWGQDYNPSMKDVLSIPYNFHWKIQNAELVPWPDPEHRMEYYSVLCYLPDALGMALARALHLGTVPMIYIGRIFTFFAYTAAMYHAINIAPVGKSVFACLALFPMSLMYSAAGSYDTMVIISTMCFIASTLMLHKEPDNKRFLIESMFWGFVIGGVKGGGYLILLPLVFIFISGNRKKSLQMTVPVIVSGVISVILFDVILPAGSSLFQFGAESSGKYSASYGFAHPVFYFDMLARTYLNNADSLLINMGGTALGWLEATLPSVIVVGLMLICGIWSVYENDGLVLNKRERFIFLFVILLEFYFTPIMLLSWTDVNSTSIAGLQGRYYIPVLPLIFMVCTKFMLHNNMKAVPDKARVAVEQRCMKLFSLLSVLGVYYLMRLYLTR